MPGLFDVRGQYDQIPRQWDKVFKVHKSDMAVERSTQMRFLGLPQYKQEGAATNADNGYTISVLGNSLTSGNNVLPPLSTLSVSLPGTNQFGMNLRSNIAPNVGAEPSGPGSASPVGNYAVPDNYIFKNGDAIASVGGPDNYRIFTASYIVNINASQPSGYYATTITYLAVGNY